MNAPFQLTPQATEDLDAVWWIIAEDNRDLANGSRWRIFALNLLESVFGLSKLERVEKSNTGIETSLNIGAARGWKMNQVLTPSEAYLPRCCDG
jgi:hypothetical protein